MSYSYSDYAERRAGIYRSRDGVICGVIRGLAEHFDVSVFWSRVAAVLLLLATDIWPVAGIYILAALLMKKEPLWRAY